MTFIGHVWHPGDRVAVHTLRGEQPWRDAWHEWQGRHGTLVAEHGRYSHLMVIALDDGGPTVEIPCGCVGRETTPEEEARARRNVVAAGYRLELKGSEWGGPPRWRWWRTSEGGGNGWAVPDPTDADPEPICESICDAYGHDLPPCTECGLPVQLGFGNRPDKRGLCFTCDHWLALAANPAAVRVRSDDGRVSHYVPRTPHLVHGVPDRSCLGFGGATFRFRFFDGRPDVVSNDVFTQGTVPAMFADRLPANAEIVRS